MKKIFTLVILACSLVFSAKAVTVSDASGVYKGTLNIGGTSYSNKEVYVLPGTGGSFTTLIMPSVAFSSKCADLVLVDMVLNNNGTLSSGCAATYVKSISASSLSESSMSFTMSLTTPSHPVSVTMTFDGEKVTNRNYELTNGGFEDGWSNGEPTGWHSFRSATGSLASFVNKESTSSAQFSQSTDVRPGTAGSHSAHIQSRMAFGNKANGNCTNGQINAGSMTASDASGNYNFSDPSNNGYNTEFVGQPDSLVFWAKYIPGGGSVTDNSNKARANAVITQNARYQDPETGSYGSVKVGNAEINYSATSSKGWQRLSIPFVYTSLDPKTASYILVTFSSNATPGGGNSSSNNLDNIYLDDVEIIYNHALQTFKMGNNTISFSNGHANTTAEFSDSDYTFLATTNGKAAKSFIGFDAEHNQVLVYVVADSYSQVKAYSVYTLQMAEPVPPVLDTEYSYAATTCDNAPYSDELFQNLTEGGTYQTTIPNTQGGDSLITLTLTVLPTYAVAETAEMNMDETYTWHEKLYKELVPGVHHDTLSLQTLAGCDSVYTLTLTVKPIAYAYDDIVTACRNEETSWHGKPLPTAEQGTFVLYDSLKSVYGMDSVYRLTLTVLPTWRFEEMKYVNEADLEWRGKTIKDMPRATEPYLFYDSLTASNGCDSTYVLVLYVSDIPVAYGAYEAVICDGESVTFEGVSYSEAFEGDIHVDELNVLGGDSIVRLTVTVLPSYTIEEYMTVNQGSNVEWEGYRLGNMDLGEMTLSATYYTVDDCDSTLVLHLTVRPIATDMETTAETDKRCAQKVFYNGHLYIIREDESIYDILGKKIK